MAGAAPGAAAALPEDPGDSPPKAAKPQVSLGTRVASSAAGVLGGVLLVVQGGVNTNLRKHAVQNPFAAACVSFAVGLGSVGAVAVLHRPRCGGVTLRAAPWYAFTGGLLGPVYVVTAILVAERLGYSAFQLCATAGQLSTGMVCDACGFLGIRKRRPTLRRVLALLAIGGGAALSIDLSVNAGSWWEVVLYMLAAAAAAGIFPVQACVNAVMVRHVQTPFRAATISFAGGTIILLLLSVVVVSATTEPLETDSGEVWMWTGGICGATLVTANVIGVPRLGAAAYMAIFIASQLATAFVLDAVGAMGFKKVEPTAQRVCGTLLAAAAAAVYQLPPPDCIRARGGRDSPQQLSSAAQSGSGSAQPSPKSPASAPNSALPPSEGAAPSAGPASDGENCLQPTEAMQPAAPAPVEQRQM